MLTPQEIQEKKFEKALFGGYDMAQIDDFLDVVLSDYTSLYKENATLKGKMRVLVDKIEEYRAVDEQMRKALYAAQISSREIVTKAQAEADEIRAQARREADAQVGDLGRLVATEEQRLEKAKQEMSGYAERIRTLMSGSLAMLEQIIQAPRAAAGKETPIETKQADRAFKIEFPESVTALADEPATGDTQELPGGPSSPLMAEQFPEVKLPEDMETKYFEIDLSGAYAAPGSDSGEEESDTAKIYGDSPFTPKPRFDFTNLKFGKDYKDNDEE